MLEASAVHDKDAADEPLSFANTWGNNREPQPALTGSCPEFRPPKINFNTSEEKCGTMLIIFSARRCCGHQPSSSPQSDTAT